MDICWNCWELNSQLIKIFFIVPTIGLLLEITAQRCTLHNFSSTVEIFENSFWSYRTLFSKIHKYLAKIPIAMVGTVCNCSIFLARCNGSKFHKCNLRPSFALGVRADVQPKSSIPIGAQVEFGPKGWNRKNIFNQPQVTNKCWTL
jgi:hypothetical protein